MRGNFDVVSYLHVKVAIDSFQGSLSSVMENGFELSVVRAGANVFNCLEGLLGRREKIDKCIERC